MPGFSMKKKRPRCIKRSVTGVPTYRCDDEREYKGRLVLHAPRKGSSDVEHLSTWDKKSPPGFRAVGKV